MSKIVDPDQLAQGTEIVFDTTAKTIQLLVAGNLDNNSPGRTSGVTHQALYSFAKDEFLIDSNLQGIRFPFDPIFEASFLWVHNWQPKDTLSQDLIRDGGFRIELLDKEYACIISLGNIDNPAADQAYYQNVFGFDQTTIVFDKTGELNEPILVLDGATDFRNFLKVYLREQGKTYSEGNLLIDQDLAGLSLQAYRLPLLNIPDLNVSTGDVAIDADAPYTGMGLSFLKGAGFTTYADATVYLAEAVVKDATGRWFFTPGGGTSNVNAGPLETTSDIGITDWESYAGERQIGAAWYAFNRIVDGNGANRFQIYEWAQRQLRKTTNINNNLLGGINQNAFGTVNGNVAVLLAGFIGDTLKTNPGVFIGNFDVNDTNFMQFEDITVDGGGLTIESTPKISTVRIFPFVAAGNITFSENLVAEPDVDTFYSMFFQYITRDTATDVAMTLATGDTGTLTSTAIDFTVNFAATDFVRISGFATAENNGTYNVVGNPTAGSMVVQRSDKRTIVVDEAAGDTVSLDSKPYDTPSRVVVLDNNSVPIQGQIIAGSIPFSFDYDGNNQQGRTPATNAAVAITAQGKELAQWVDGSFTITRATGLNFPLNAATERVYLNPI